MNTAELRSLLTHSIHDLGEITSADIAEMKWQTTKRLLSKLIENSPELHVQSDALSGLLQARNTLLISRRNGKDNVSKAVKNEQDIEFKHVFLRIVIDGLTLLRWPPALEAFSDPLDSLMHDRSSIISAITHLLYKGVLKHSEIKPLHNQGGYENATTTSDRIEELKGRNTGRIKDNDPSHSSPRGKQRSPKLGLTGRTTSRDGMSNNHYVSSATDLSENSYVDQYLQQQSQQEYQLPQISESSASSSDDYAKLMFALQVSQHQNEVLSKGLAQLQEAIGARENAEDRLSSIIGELKATVDEIVGIGVGTRKRAGIQSSTVLKVNGTASSGSIVSMSHSVAVQSKVHNKRVLTDELEMEFRREIEREETAERNELKDKEEVDIGITLNDAGKNPSRSKRTVVDSSKVLIGQQHDPPSAATGSSVVWSKLQGRLSELHQQWEEARRDSRSAVLINANVLPSTNLKSDCTYLKNRNSPGNGGTKNTNGASILTGRSAWKDGGDNNSSSNTCRSTRITSAVDGRRLSGVSSERSSINSASCYGSPTASLSCRLRLHQILGVRLPLSIAGDESISGGNSDENSDGSHHGLDLARIHLLQRDLVDFSNAAFTLLCPEKNNRTSVAPPQKQQSDIHTVDPMPLDRNDGDWQLSLLHLRERARNLLLHLSCLAPLAPLVSPAPWTSSLTGLDVLEKEIVDAVDKLGGRRAPVTTEVTLRLQAASDRVRSEQMALMRSLQASQMLLRQWPAATQRIAPLMDTLGKNLRETFSRSRAEVCRLCEATGTISTALQAVEATRTDGQPSPLDSLARGKMGLEMAALVSSLRLHSHEVASTAQCLDELRRQLARDIDKELLDFERAKKSLLAASKETASSSDSIEDAVMFVARQNDDRQVEKLKPKRHQRPNGTVPKAEFTF